MRAGCVRVCLRDGPPRRRRQGKYLPITGEAASKAAAAPAVAAAAKKQTTPKTPAKKAPKPTLPQAAAPQAGAVLQEALKQALVKQVEPKVKKVSADGTVAQYERVPGNSYAFVTVLNDRGFLEGKYAPVA